MRKIEPLLTLMGLTVSWIWHNRISHKTELFSSHIGAIIKVSFLGVYHRSHFKFEDSDVIILPKIQLNAFLPASTLNCFLYHISSS